MKRSDALAPLSRDHHQALAVALSLTRATAADIGDAVRRFEGFWAQYGDRHFEIEESLLLPALPASAPGWGEASERVRREHADLRARAAELLTASRPATGAAVQFGERLQAHVRFEEREVFPLAERELADDALEELGRAIAAAEERGVP